jgi:hypothetical protein
MAKNKNPREMANEELLNQQLWAQERVKESLSPSQRANQEILKNQQEMKRAVEIEKTHMDMDKKLDQQR